MNVFFITLGCKVNQYESQAMLNQLCKAGFSAAASLREADVAVVNSCTVTAASDHKVRQALRHARKENPGAVLVLTGCFPQAFPTEAAALPEADVVLGNANRAALLPDLQAYLSTRQKVVDIAPHRNGEPFEAMSVQHFFERTRAFVKIEDGCNRFCSYCIIPYARGRVRSKPLDALRRELAALGAAGYRETVLTGINLSAYGQDLGLHLCDAVEAACAVPGIRRVRLGSLEPEQLSDAVIARLARAEKLCPQFHLSLQSGCDETLRRMNRHYDTAEYRRIAGALRAAFPNAAITTDIMVGFPGETEEEFAQSLAFARETGFARAHVFAYSRRPGTRAYQMPGQVSRAEKERRSREMIRETEKTKRAFLESQTGLLAPVLLEREIRPGLFEGYTPNYTPVHAAGPGRPGEICPVRLTRAGDERCEGTIVTEGEDRHEN